MSGKVKIEVSMDRAQWRYTHADCVAVIENVQLGNPGESVDGVRERYAVLRDAIERRFPKLAGKP